MQARMQNPAYLVPGAMDALMALGKVSRAGAVPQRTHELVHLRASQLNGCAVCVEMAAGALDGHGDAEGPETPARLLAVSAWRESPHFSGPERAALALTEAVTRLADRPDPVPDDLWAEAARHYDEPALAELLLSIAATNVWNRLNTPTRQVPGAWSA